MPYLNQQRKSNGAIAMDHAIKSAKPSAKIIVKMPPPVKIPAPMQNKAK